MRAPEAIGIAALSALTPVDAALCQQIPLSRQFPVAAVETLGAEIYRQDIASGIGSDLLLDAVEDPAAAGVLGWVTTEDADGILVSFVGLSDGEFVALYDARPGESERRAFVDARGRSLTELELTLFLARMTATRHIGELCSSRYNTVIVPDPEGDAWLVYQLAATADAGIMPVGGHYRITVSSDGTEVLATEPLFASCLALDIADQLTSAGGAPEEIRLEQDVGTVPLETNVFLNLLFDLDLTVVTSVDGSVWTIRDGRILSSGAEPDFL
jgi:hypothetical protein